MVLVFAGFNQHHASRRDAGVLVTVVRPAGGNIIESLAGSYCVVGWLCM